MTQYKIRKVDTAFFNHVKGTAKTNEEATFDSLNAEVSAIATMYSNLISGKITPLPQELRQAVSLLTNSRISTVLQVTPRSGPILQA